MSVQTYADQFYEFFNSEEEKIAFLETKPIEGWWKNFYNHMITNCFRYKGVENRSDYWRFIAIEFFISFIMFTTAGLYVAYQVLHYPAYNNDAGFTYVESNNFFPGITTFLFIVFSFWTFFASLSATCRRFHDVNMSGWLQLVACIPLGQIVVLIICLKKSDYTNNTYLYTEAVSSGFIRKYRNKEQN